jgi:hypothetical protein
MTRGEFIEKIRIEEEYVGILEGLAALILCACPDAATTSEDEEKAYFGIMGRLAKKGEDELLQEALSVGLVE